MPHDDGRKSRCSDAGMITKRSSHIPTLTNIATTNSQNGEVRKRLNHISCGARPLQIQSATYIFAYGPVMLHEALSAGEAVGACVVNMPWLNRVDPAWLQELVDSFEHLFVVEDHAPVGGLADTLRRELGGRVLTVLGVEGWPACGTPAEALRFHGLDGASLAARIEAAVPAKSRE